MALEKRSVRRSSSVIEKSTNVSSGEKPAFDFDKSNEEDDEESEEDEDFLEMDSSSDGDNSDTESDDDDGGKRKRKRKLDIEKPNKKIRGLEFVDDEEVKALREEVIEAYGANALKEKKSSEEYINQSRLAFVRDVYRSMENDFRSSLKRKVDPVGSVSPCVSVLNGNDVPFKKIVQKSKDLFSIIGTSAMRNNRTSDVSVPEDLPGLLNKKVSSPEMVDSFLLKLNSHRRKKRRTIGTSQLLFVKSGGRYSQDPKDFDLAVSDPMTDKPPAKIQQLLDIATKIKGTSATKVAVTREVMFAGEKKVIVEIVSREEAARRAASEDATAAAASARSLLNSVSADSEGPAPTSISSVSLRPAARLTLDAVVDNLDKPETINTLAKTGADWETYKAQHGLDESFEARASRAGFVEKQSFLARADERAGELELQQRALQRKKREQQQ